jgi:hypothetical protein
MRDHLRQARNARQRGTKPAQRVAPVAAALHQVERGGGLAEHTHPLRWQGPPRRPVPRARLGRSARRAAMSRSTKARSTWEWTKPATRSNSASPSLRAIRAAKGHRPPPAGRPETPEAPCARRRIAVRQAWAGVWGLSLSGQGIRPSAVPEPPASGVPPSCAPCRKARPPPDRTGSRRWHPTGYPPAAGSRPSRPAAPRHWDDR